MAEPELEPTNLTDRVVRGAGLAGSGYVLGQVLTLSSYLVLARLLNPSDFGVFAAGTLLVSIGLLFTESGMMAAIIHRKDRVDEAASTAVVACSLAGFGFSLLALAAAPLMTLIFDDSKVGEVTAVTAGLLLLRSFQVVPEAMLQRRLSFLRRMIVEPTGVLAFGVASVIAASNDMGVWALVIGYYAAGVTDVVLSWALVGWRPRLRQASVAMWRELIGYGRYVLASVAVMRLGQQVPVILIGRSVGTAALGQFRYAERMSGTPVALIVQSAAYVIFPALARITTDRDRFRDACVRSLRLMCAVGFPLGLLLIPLGIPAALILFGDVWYDAGEAAMMLSGFCVGAILISFVSEVVKADGKPGIQARTQTVSVVTGAIAMLALLPFDLLGVVAGVSIGALIGGVYGLVRVHTALEFRGTALFAEIWPPLIAAAVMAGALLALDRLVVEPTEYEELVGAVLLALEALVGALLYLLVLYALARGTVRDLISSVGTLRLRPQRAPAPPEAG